MGYSLGDVSAVPLFPAEFPAQPLNAQLKQQLLSQMPFVSEPVGDDITDLAAETPSGKTRRNRHALLGALGGVALAIVFFKATGQLRSKGKK